MSMRQFVFNPKSRTVHLMIDGMTKESCNVDQIKKRIVVDSLKDIEVKHKLCTRCFYAETPTGTVQ